MAEAWRPWLDAARPFLAQAAQHDQKADPQPAIENYMAGIEKLMQALKVMDNGEQKQRLNGEIVKYMGRAEFLKGNTSFGVESMRTHRIPEDSTGHSYERIFKDVLNSDLHSVHVFDAYVSVHHQVLNFVRFCELLVAKAPKLCGITLSTSEDSRFHTIRQNAESFKELAASLQKRKITLSVNYKKNLHDREIRFDNKWIVKMGRGLDYFKPVPKYSIGALDMSMRPCKECNVDIYKLK
ncbi:hypothetical protein PFISCL1PPCAC_10702 [Pristionchus fissidentatus]|uniref:MIT domain-containing protein n=1 Tax=Pristionchus fissidentatus TaxID=1538716 RepID=A0AAV5VL80_9BILA|nr:hypothetical protein PFISCL1PPCAC_10702 [Pristionchus fissidentatus]